MLLTYLVGTLHDQCSCAACSHWFKLAHFYYHEHRMAPKPVECTYVPVECTFRRVPDPKLFHTGKGCCGFALKLCTKFRCRYAICDCEHHSKNNFDAKRGRKRGRHNFAVGRDFFDSMQDTLVDKLFEDWHPNLKKLSGWSRPRIARKLLKKLRAEVVEVSSDSEGDVLLEGVWDRSTITAITRNILTSGYSVEENSENALSVAIDTIDDRRARDNGQVELPESHVELPESHSELVPANETFLDFNLIANTPISFWDYGNSNLYRIRTYCRKNHHQFLNDGFISSNPIDPSFNIEEWVENKLLPFLSMPGRDLTDHFNYAGEVNPPDQGLHSLLGRWIYFHSAEPHVDKDDWHYLYHGCPIYVLRRVNKMGFEAAWTHLTKADSEGTYGHTAEESSCSMAYSIHHPLFHDGVLIAPLVEIYAPLYQLPDHGTPKHRRFKKTKDRKRVIRNTQWLAFPGNMVISGIYFHLLHQHDLEQYPAYSKLRIAHPWQPQLELSGTVSRKEWIELSKKKRLLRDKMQSPPLPKGPHVPTDADVLEDGFSPNDSSAKQGSSRRSTWERHWYPLSPFPVEEQTQQTQGGVIPVDLESESDPPSS